MLKMDVINIQQKPCSRNVEIPGGRGESSKSPLEWKFLRGGGRGANQKPSVGGVWIFSGTTQYFRWRETTAENMSVLQASLKQGIEVLVRSEI